MVSFNQSLEKKLIAEEIFNGRVMIETVLKVILEPSDIQPWTVLMEGVWNLGRKGVREGEKMYMER